MSRKICSVEGCENFAEGHGLCPKHLWKKKKYGDPLAGKSLNRCGITRRHPRTYKSWLSMRARCYDAKSISYPRYGSRGIKVCDEWQGVYGFANFLRDMGSRPKGTTLDRIDVNGDYCKDNCRWSTTKEQANNRRSNIVIEIEGEAHTLKEWCGIFGVEYTTAHLRYKKGWPLGRPFVPPTR